MSYDVEHLLVSKAMWEGDVLPAVDAKVTEEFFRDPLHREVWEFILEQWREYGEVPTARTLKGNYPNYKLLRVEEPYEQLIDTMRSRRRLELAVGMATEINTALRDEDVDGALDALAQGLNEIHTEVSVMRDANLSDEEDTVKRYERYTAEREEGLLGVPSGFPTIDEATNGFQPEQLVTLIGLPKQNKSMIMLRIAKAVHEAGKVPLVVTFEMSNDEQAMRYDAMRAGVGLTALQTGNLSKTQDRKLRASLDSMKDEHPFILSADVNSATTVTGLAAKIEQYRPDMLFVDGVYLMDDEGGEAKGSSQALTNITRGLKRLAQRQRIPIMLTTQVLPWKYSKARGLQADAIGYTSSFAQDSDVIMGIDSTEDEDVRSLRIVLSRNCSPKEVFISADWSTTTFEELDGYERSEDAEQDAWG